MPLSKAKDAERKKIQRAATRFHKQLEGRIAKAAHFALDARQEEARLDKHFSSPQTTS